MRRRDEVIGREAPADYGVEAPHPPWGSDYHNKGDSDSDVRSSRNVARNRIVNAVIVE